MASIRKISLLLRLVVAGTSVVSGVSALASERLLEGSAPKKRMRSLDIPDPHRPISRPGIRKKSLAVQHSWFLGT
jgi:hypothetical protein